MLVVQPLPIGHHGLWAAVGIQPDQTIEQQVIDTFGGGVTGQSRIEDLGRRRDRECDAVIGRRLTRQQRKTQAERYPSHHVVKGRSLRQLL